MPMAVNGTVRIFFSFSLSPSYRTITDDDPGFVKTFKKQEFGHIWLGLCCDNPKSEAVIRSYFCDYVEGTQTTRPVLREQEYEVVQTITTTRTVITRWKNLVAEADNTILREKRRKDPDN